MSTMTKRWWRVAVLSAVAGGAIGVARYAAANDEPAVWGPSTTPPVEAVAVALPPAAALPAAATPPAAAFPVPVPPAATQPPVTPPALDPPAPGPRAPLTPPVLPGVDLPGIPPAPKPIDISPVAPPMPLLPPLTDPKPLTLPAPTPVAPPPAEIAQPAPPAKSADPVKPITPVVPDFNLQPPKPANSVRTNDGATPGLPVGPTLPPVTPPASSRRDVPAVPVDRPKPAEGPLLDSEKYTFPLPTPTPPTPHPGDPVMANYFKQSALAAVIGGALAGAPLTPATAFPVPTQVKTEPTPAELKKSLDETNRKLAEVQASLNRLTELIDGRKDEKGFYLPSDLGVATDVKNLKNTVQSLQAQLDAMKSSSSLRPPTPLPAPDPMAGKGTVRVVNDYPVEISIVVNEKSHRIAPNTKQDVPVPAGDFSYQLLQNGASAVKSTIKEKEVVTLRIK